MSYQVTLIVEFCENKFSLFGRDPEIFVATKHMNINIDPFSVLPERDSITIDDFRCHVLSREYIAGAYEYIPWKFVFHCRAFYGDNMTREVEQLLKDKGWIIDVSR
jgi:hypothetical protein